MSRGFANANLIVILMALILIGGGALYVGKISNQSQTQPPQSTKAPQSTKVTLVPEDTNQEADSFIEKLSWDTSAWKIYTNNNLNISFKYPNDLVYEENPRNLEDYKNVPYFFEHSALNDYHKECIRLSKSDPSPVTLDWELSCDRRAVLFMIHFREYKDQEIKDFPSNHFLPSIEIIDSQQRKWDIQSDPGYSLGVRAISQNQAGNRLYLSFGSYGNRLTPYLEKAFLFDSGTKNTDEKYQMTLMAAFLREILSTFKSL